jgi:hypothetical protein
MRLPSDSVGILLVEAIRLRLRDWGILYAIVSTVEFRPPRQPCGMGIAGLGQVP